MTSALRDLAARIEQLTREHPAYSQAWGPVQNLSNHLQAMARVEEINKVATDTNPFTELHRQLVKDGWSLGTEHMVDGSLRMVAKKNGLSFGYYL